MPRVKDTAPLTHGYMPSNMSMSQLSCLCGEEYRTDRVLLFWKYLMNRSTVRYVVANGRRKYVGTGAPEIEAWVEIHSDYVETLFGREQSAGYKQFMVENGLIEVRNYSAQNGKACEYRIPWALFKHELFGGATFYRKVPVTDKRSYNAERNLYKLRKARSIAKLAPEYQTLVKVLEGLRIDLASPHARSIVDTYKLNRPLSDLHSYSYLEFLEAVDGKDIEYYFVDAFGNRFHTAYAMLKRQIRPLLYFADRPDEKLASLDIKCSQPWLTSVMTPDIIAAYVPEAVELLPAFAALLQCPERDEYQALCTSGQVYEHWQEEIEAQHGIYWREDFAALDRQRVAAGGKPQPGEALDDPSLTDRDAAKKCLYRVIYGYPKADDPLHVVFRTLWPNIWTALESIKKAKKLEASTSDKAYANMSFVMQRLEAEFMRRCIVKFFENGINHLVTIYDGVLVLESQQTEAKALMLEVASDMGLPLPQIKVGD